MLETIEGTQNILRGKRELETSYAVSFTHVTADHCADLHPDLVSSITPGMHYDKAGPKGGRGWLPTIALSAIVISYGLAIGMARAYLTVEGNELSNLTWGLLIVGGVTVIVLLAAYYISGSRKISAATAADEVLVSNMGKLINDLTKIQAREGYYQEAIRNGTLRPVSSDTGSSSAHTARSSDLGRAASAGVGAAAGAGAGAGAGVGVGTGKGARTPASDLDGQSAASSGASVRAAELISDGPAVDRSLRRHSTDPSSQATSVSSDKEEPKVAPSS